MSALLSYPLARITIEFLDQRVDPMPVDYTDKFIKDICIVFFHQGEWEVVRLFVVAGA
jgi:hypothetical protein